MTLPITGYTQQEQGASPATQSPLSHPFGAEPVPVSGKAGIANAGHTPGPWRWEVNRKSKRVELCGGPPKGGFGRYDLTVLSFRRYGMNGAAPVFWHWDQARWVGKPQRADELAVAAEGREHHADWFALIDHPDARLIAAAPELLEALDKYADDLCEGWCENSPDCAHFDDCAGCLARRTAYLARGAA